MGESDAAEALGEGDVGLLIIVSLHTGQISMSTKAPRATLAVTCEPNAFVFDAAEFGLALGFVSVSCCLSSRALLPFAVVPTDTVTLDKLEMSLGAVQANVVGAVLHRFILLLQ